MVAGEQFFFLYINAYHLNKHKAIMLLFSIHVTARLAKIIVRTLAGVCISAYDNVSGLP